MSFSINTNLMAMDAMNNLNQVSDQLGQSMNRLSTGLRINSAADDPAGLIMSQQMDATINGMGQALQNTQEGINFIKTADGALGQINSLLNNAYSLAVQAANSAVMSGQETQADQQQLQSIVSSITTIANTAQYGTKYLLNGNSGVQSAVTDTADINSLNIGGTFAGQAITANAPVTITAYTAATQAAIAGAGSYATINTKVAAAGSFSINGVTFTASANDTAGDLVNMINGASNQTGVVATYDATNKSIDLSSEQYGSAQTINLVDSGGLVKSTTSASGTDAKATLQLGTATAAFTGGLNGNNGLTLEDSDGNTLTVSTAGNANATLGTNTAIGQVEVGSAQFQTGAEPGQVEVVSIGNFAASNLGQGAVNGLNLANLDLTTTSGASNAMLVIQKAINDVTTARGRIGSFQANVLQVNVNNLTTAQENLSSSLSTIQDTNVAQEMTNFTKLQILEQSGMSVLAQANQIPQQILNLIKSG